ncbi:MAG UNVERIFIED_CONTAM: hypothetical protein LVT10_00830 [Anaerolineae bacterium]
MLGNTVQGEFSQALAPLTNAYRHWLEERQSQIEQADDLLRPYVEQGIAEDQIRKGWIALERIQAGIELLDNHADAARAFQFANSGHVLTTYSHPVCRKSTAQSEARHQSNRYP